VDSGKRPVELLSVLVKTGEAYIDELDAVRLVEAPNSLDSFYVMKLECP
jgi:hypothetical protein